MSDFYSILRKSILDRSIVNGDERDVIYAQARRAMIRRLWSFDPPLDEEEVERRIAAFDVAVSDIEADVAATFAEEALAAAEEDDGPVMDDRYLPDSEPDDYGTDGYRADAQDVRYGKAEDYPAANSRRLPAIAHPTDYARQMREAGRYDEGARRESEGEERPHDTDYDARFEEPETKRPAERGQSRALTYRQSSKPPVDPYGSEPGYGEEPPPPARRQPHQQNRWALDSPREGRNPSPRKAAQTPQQRRIGPDDDLPRRRERQRQRPREPLSDRDKIFMLLGIIGVCVLVLGGIGVYALVPRDGGVTVDIDAHREVSDAATAVRLAAETLPVDQTFMLFDGRDPTIFETSPDNPVRFDASAGTVRISSSAGSAGVKALIGPGLATRLAGHNVRVTIVARSAREAGAAGMRFAYQSGVAISHWQTANLGADYQAVALTWRVPSLQTDRSGDLLLIQPGVPGDGTGTEVKSIKIDLLAS